MTARLPRAALSRRYDVSSMVEDAWHSDTDRTTRAFVRRTLDSVPVQRRGVIINAGCGVYELNAPGWTEVSIDQFCSPMQRRDRAICGDVHRIPIGSGRASAVVCVGEVLAYCEPATVVQEFARILTCSGILIVDHRSTRSPKYWGTPVWRRAADIVIDQYNGSDERTWVYDPSYIHGLLLTAGFQLQAQADTHGVAAIIRRASAPVAVALAIDRLLAPIAGRLLPGDLVTTIAVRT